MGHPHHHHGHRPGERARESSPWASPSAWCSWSSPSWPIWPPRPVAGGRSHERPVHPDPTSYSATTSGVVLRIPHLAVAEGLDSRPGRAQRGGGKSTLLRLLAFLETPVAGEVRYRDQPTVGREYDLRGEVTYFPQEPYLLKRTVRANVGYGLVLRGRAGRARAGGHGPDPGGARPGPVRRPLLAAAFRRRGQAGGPGCPAGPAAQGALARRAHGQPRPRQRRSGAPGGSRSPGAPRA